MKKTITIDSSALIGLFLALVFGLIVGAAQPWIGVNEAFARTIEVEGTATLDAAPDENVFYPQYEVKNDDRTIARDRALKIGNKVVDDLIELGVEKSKITSDVQAYEDWDCFNCNQAKGFVGYNSLTIKINDEELSEKVFNLLLDTDATGSVTPQSSFSDEKVDELKAEARSLAVEKARTQAEQIASELGDKIGEVISIEEQEGSDDFFGYYVDDEVALSTEEGADFDIGATRDAPLLTGEQELRLTVKAVFEIK